MWLSLVERCVRDAKAAGSNPVIPTKDKTAGNAVFSTASAVFILPFTGTTQAIKRGKSGISGNKV